MRKATRVTRVGRDGPEFKLCDECNAIVRSQGHRTFHIDQVDPEDDEDCERCVDPADFDEAAKA